ncbi:hypothetical protein Tco_1281503, partial [Tanacetum coccineum]
ISTNSFLSFILLVVVVIVMVILIVVVVAIVGVVIVVAIFGVVVVVDGVSFIFKLSFMIIGFLLGVCIPPRQGIIGLSSSSKCYSVFLGTLATRKYRFSTFKPTDEVNNSFRAIEVERLTIHELFIVSSFFYRSSSRSDVTVTPSNLSTQQNVEYPRALHLWINSTRPENDY